MNCDRITKYSILNDDFIKTFIHKLCIYSIGNIMWRHYIHLAWHSVSYMYESMSDIYIRFKQQCKFQNIYMISFILEKQKFKYQEVYLIFQSTLRGKLTSHLQMRIYNVMYKYMYMYFSYGQYRQLLLFIYISMTPNVFQFICNQHLLSEKECLEKNVRSPYSFV